MELYDHQKEALMVTASRNRVAYYHDMGLGKTFTGAEKMKDLGCDLNLVVCQKSKVDDWIEHFRTNYAEWFVYNLTSERDYTDFIMDLWPPKYRPMVGVINYDLIFRRPELKKLSEFTLLLDESSMVKNETAKRSKFILKTEPKNVILLSGTPTGGKYEELWSQMHLLGWNISKKLFYNQYIEYHWDDQDGFPRMVIDGYKNEERLKRKMREHGCHFLKTGDVFDLPEQVHQWVMVKPAKEYRKFRDTSICTIGDDQLVGDNILTQLLYERQLCGHYSESKLEAFQDLLESTNDRLIVFYNFKAELSRLLEITQESGRPCSMVNGDQKDLTAYEKFSDSVTFIQYQAGAMGLNLQKANKIVYFTPTLSSELFEQSKKRIHRIGQDRTCFYYYLTCKPSVEQHIYRVLKMRRNYTEALFEQGA